MCVRRVRVSGTRSLDGTRNGSTRPEVNTGGGVRTTWQRSIRTHARAAASNLLRYSVIR